MGDYDTPKKKPWCKLCERFHGANDAAHWRLVRKLAQ